MANVGTKVRPQDPAATSSMWAVGPVGCLSSFNVVD